VSELLIIRDGSIPGVGTFSSEFHAAGQVFAAVEQPWLADADHPAGVPFHSCVPAGIYELEPHDTERHPNCWALVNHDLGVYHWDDPHAHRTACLIHVANWPHNVEGCIGPGRKLGYVANASGKQWLGVNDSGAVLDILRKALDPKQEHTLEIRWREHK